MMMKCYVWGQDSDWEAICTDLDIAVQDCSLESTKILLDEAITGYLHEVEELPPSEQNKFLNRRAPFSLRMKLHIKFSLFLMRNQFRDVSSNIQKYSIPTTYSAS